MRLGDLDALKEAIREKLNWSGYERFNGGVGLHDVLDVIDNAQVVELPVSLTDAEKIVCKAYLDDLDKIHSCNEYHLLMRLIDNAPTVETNIEAVAKDAYKQGYTDGWKERFGEPEE